MFTPPLSSFLHFCVPSDHTILLTANYNPSVPSRIDSMPIFYIYYILYMNYIPISYLCAYLLLYTGAKLTYIYPYNHYIHSKKRHLSILPAPYTSTVLFLSYYPYCPACSGSSCPLTEWNPARRKDNSSNLVSRYPFRCLDASYSPSALAVVLSPIAALFNLNTPSNYRHSFENIVSILALPVYPSVSNSHAPFRAKHPF